MELSVTRTSLSAIMFLLIVCSAEALNYLAFPRMGRSVSSVKRDMPRYFVMPRKRQMPTTFILPRRGYLAFPRMGRGQSKAEAVPDAIGCCGAGLKSEFLIGQYGKEELRAACPVSASCCEGLREVVDESQDGTYYSLCVPDSGVQRETNAHSSDVLRKMKRLMKK